MSLRFINEEVEGEIIKISMFCSELNYEFKYIFIKIDHKNPEVAFFNNMPGNESFIYSMYIDEDILCKFWDKYFNTNTICKEFEEYLQEMIDNHSSNILCELDKLYKQIVLRAKDNLNRVEEKHKNIRDCYSKELIFI